MEEHRIGTPTLQLRIMKADARGRELPLSTLQRFIAGSHRTSDAYVDMCRRFLERAGVAGEVIDVAEALAAHFGDENSEQARARAAAFADQYRIHATPWDAERAGNAPYALARFDHVPGKPYLKVAEEAHEVAKTIGSPRRHRYEGTLVFNDRLVHGFLRSCITRQPKTYTLRSPGPGAMTSSVLLEGAVLYGDRYHEIHQLAVRIVNNRGQPHQVGADEELT